MERLAFTTLCHANGKCLQCMEDVLHQGDICQLSEFPTIATRVSFHHQCLKFGSQNSWLVFNNPTVGLHTHTHTHTPSSLTFSLNISLVPLNTNRGSSCWHFRAHYLSLRQDSLPVLRCRYYFWDHPVSRSSLHWNEEGGSSNPTHPFIPPFCGNIRSAFVFWRFWCVHCRVKCQAKIIATTSCKVVPLPRRLSSTSFCCCRSTYDLL